MKQCKLTFSYYNLNYTSYNLKVSKMSRNHAWKYSALVINFISGIKGNTQLALKKILIQVCIFSRQL